MSPPFHRPLPKAWALCAQRARAYVCVNKHMCVSTHTQSQSSYTQVPPHQLVCPSPPYRRLVEAWVPMGGAGVPEGCLIPQAPLWPGLSLLAKGMGCGRAPQSLGDHFCL